MRRNKYGVRIDAAGKAARTADGILFGSLSELRRYKELKLLERAKRIWALAVHPTRYPLHVNGITVGHYTPDFEYCQHDAQGEFQLVTEDVKGRHARDWPLRKAVFEACYTRQITEIRYRRKKRRARRAA